MSDPAPPRTQPHAPPRSPQLADRLEDLLHVGVGLSILAFQKAQVHRRDLARALRRLR